MDSLSSSSDWSLPKKIGFRFIFLFFLLYIAIHNNGAFPFWGILFEYPTEGLEKLIPWIGKHILGISYEITVMPTGSGDTTYDYVALFTIFVTAFLGTLTWSIVDRARRNYDTLYYWLTVAIRFYVGLMLIQYGLIKVIKLQFPSPGLYRLAQNYGDSSPMGLAWTFLGFSNGYNVFMGIAEVSAILLLFRRTLTIGAFITLMTTANVMAVNYFYDIPVKILSTALVTMSLFLLLNNAKQLWMFFLTGEAVSLPVIKAHDLKKRWLKITKMAFKALIIGYALIYGIIDLQESRKLYGDQAPKPKLYGLYNVDLFVVNNDTLPPLTTDSLRWRQLVIEWDGYAKVRHMADNSSSFYTKMDSTASQKIDFTLRKDSTIKYSFDYAEPDSNTFTMSGVSQGDTFSIFMTRKGLDNYRLMNRGFHWISEYPYNR